MNTAVSATSPRRSVLFAVYAVVAAIAVTWAAVILIDSLLHPTSVDGIIGMPLLRWSILLVVSPIHVVIGVMVLRRSPSNVIGLFLLIYAAAWVVSVARADIDSTLALALNWHIGGAMWYPLLTLPLLFPTGWAYPPRLARFADVALAILAFISYTIVFSDSTIDVINLRGTSDFAVPNPLYVPALEVLYPIQLKIGQTFISAIFFLSLISIILRYRASDARGRMQIRWLALAFTVTVAFAIFGFTFNLFLDFAKLGTASLPHLVFNFSFFLWIGMFPAVTLGNAMLRHRLYDIDIIIRRTLIYSILPATLALVFFGGVTVLQGLLRAATGQSSDVAIVASTLIIAALFTPLRRRVQSVIDRRFYRRKYDAEKTLAQFSQTLRVETDLAALQVSILNVVQDTMQPTHAALWTKAEHQ
ncbi:MAG: hypothetical protein KF726_00550 [Anaerolineae bacterium]|nr:hypothetical protein [Anaerolineae bacterium]